MRTHICLICLLLAVVSALASCAGAQPNEKTPQSAVISTEAVQYCGWQDYITDGTYVIAAEGFGSGAVAKYNLATGSITSVCLKSGCRHPAVSFEHTADTNCPIPPSSTLFFIHDQKVYFKYEISRFDEGELEELGSTKLLRRQIFASYDLTTGEAQSILEVDKNDYESLYTFRAIGSYIYYFRYIAKVDRPTSADDYALCLCRMKIGKYEQQVLFELAAAFPEYPAGTLPMILAVDNDTVYFVCNATGCAFYCSLSGEGGKYLIDAQKEGFWGIYDAYGTFYADGYIYFAKYVKEPQTALYLYKMDAVTGEKSILTEDYVKWFFVADDAVYYEMAQVMQPSEAQQAAAGAVGSYRYTIKQMKLDGTDSHVIGHIDAPNAESARPWGADDKLFIQMRFSKKLSETQTIMGHYDVIFDVTDGTVTEVGKPEELQ